MMSGGIEDKYTGYHNRRSTRLPGYDYSKPGYYFVTMCIHDCKQHLFGDVIDGKMHENKIADIVRQGWNYLQSHYPQIRLDEFIIMPNHIHAIIIIHDIPLVGARSSRPIGLESSRPLDLESSCPLGSGFGNDIGKHIDMGCDNSEDGRDDRAPTLGNMIAYFKYQTTKRINASGNNEIRKIWQRNYYDHIIRDEKSLYFIRQYIRNNPVHWGKEFENHLSGEIDEFHKKN
jgi:putative transposase